MQQNQTPHSIDAEKWTLATLVQHPADTADVIRTVLRSENFFIPAHSYIFDATLKLIDQRKPVDYVTLKQALTKAGQLEEAGGPEALSELWDLIAPAESIEHYIVIVREKYALRQAIIDARRIIELAYQPGTDFAQIRDEIEAILAALSMQNLKPEKSLREIVTEYREQLSTRYEYLELNGFKFGIPEVDRRVGPFAPGELVVLSAKTGGAKSLLAGQGALHSAAQGIPTAIFSLEMTLIQTLDRMFSHRANISMNSFKFGKFRKEELSALDADIPNFCDLPLHLIHQCFDIGAIASRLRKLKTKHDIKLCVVDYIQRVRPNLTRRDSSRYLEVAEVSKQLADLALELELVILAPCQLNDAGQVRESRDIENNAHAHLQIVVDPDAGPGDIELCVVKHRQGESLVSIPLHINGEFMTVEERPSKCSAHWQEQQEF